MSYEEIEEIVENLYKKYSTQIITLLIDKGILFEGDGGFGGPVIEFGDRHLEELLRNDQFDLSLSSGCHLNDGDTLYYIYNKNIFSREQAQQCAKERYEQKRFN